MTLRGLHTHGILILFWEWVSCVSFLTGWYSGSQPNASLGSVPRLLDPWLYPYFYITLSFLVLNQWCPPLMGSTEPFSPFLVCFPCSVATDSFQVLLQVLYILQTKPFFFSPESFEFIHPTAEIYFSLCVFHSPSVSHEPPSTVDLHRALRVPVLIHTVKCTFLGLMPFHQQW